jgi:phosphoglycolate phosphatase-like HAD superfamily hydrolase
MRLPDLHPILLLISPAELLDCPQEPNWHTEALRAALRDICGISHPQLPTRDGHTDWTLLDDALTHAGLSECMTEETFHALAQSAALHYTSMCPADLGQCIRPGAVAACENMAQSGRVQIVPCTGALREIAMLLFERADIARPLAIGYGAYGTFGSTRPDLIDHARRNAAGFGLPWPAHRTVLASRAAYAITAARSAGVRTVAIGRTSAAADVTISEFDELPALMSSWDAALQ